MRTGWIVSAGVIVIGLAVAALVAREHAQAKVQAKVQTRAPDAAVFSEIEPSTQVAGNLSGSRDDEPASQDAAANRNFEKELNEAEDYRQFVESVLGDAKAGNGAAQFYLSAALNECGAYDEMYFRNGDRRLTYDEAMQAAVQRRGLNWEYVSGVFKRCKRLLEAKDKPFGNADEWLKLASDNGYPQAQARVAAGKAFKSRYEQDKGRALELREEARHLALEALRTRDPGVMFMVGDAASTLDMREGAANPHEWVWVLAACERGFDCSRQSAWYQFRCGYDPNCQPYEDGIVDVVRRETGSRFPDLERRAKELNARLDEGRFDELGI